MATNRGLKSDLLSRLGCSPQAISDRVKTVKRKYGPMNTEEATYFIAHREGLDLTKYLDRTRVDRVWGLIHRSGNGEPAPRPGRRNPRHANEVIVRINPSLPNVDTMLSTNLVEDARKMSQIYPVYYILENSVRVVIKKVLEHAHGKQWWNSRVSRPIRDKVADRIAKEAAQPWHGKRGQHEIFYSDFTDLSSIIRNNWSDFSSLFPSQEWISGKLQDMEHPRNVLAHHNPLGKADRKRIELHFHDWVELLSDRKHLIP